MCILTQILCYYFCFWLHWVFAATSRGFSLTVMRDLSCPEASGILVQQGSNLSPLLLEGRYLTAGGEWLKSQVLETSLVAAQEEGQTGRKWAGSPDHFPISPEQAPGWLQDSHSKTFPRPSAIDTEPGSKAPRIGITLRPGLWCCIVVVGGCGEVQGGRGGREGAWPEPPAAAQAPHSLLGIPSSAHGAAWAGPHSESPCLEKKGERVRKAEQLKS